MRHATVLPISQTATSDTKSGTTPVWLNLEILHDNVPSYDGFSLFLQASLILFRLL